MLVNEPKSPPMPDPALEPKPPEQKVEAAPRHKIITSPTTATVCKPSPGASDAEAEAEAAVAILSKGNSDGRRLSGTTAGRAPPIPESRRGTVFSKLRSLPSSDGYQPGMRVLVARKAGNWSPGTIHVVDHENAEYIVSFEDEVNGGSHKKIPFANAKYHLQPQEDPSDTFFEAAKRLPKAARDLLEDVVVVLQEATKPIQALRDWAMRTSDKAGEVTFDPKSSPRRMAWLTPEAKAHLGSAVVPAVEELLDYLSKHGSTCMRVVRNDSISALDMTVLGTAKTGPGPYQMIRDWAREKDRVTKIRRGSLHQSMHATVSRAPTTPGAPSLRRGIRVRSAPPFVRHEHYHLPVSTRFSRFEETHTPTGATAPLGRHTSLKRPPMPSSLRKDRLTTAPRPGTGRLSPKQCPRDAPAKHLLTDEAATLRIQRSWRSHKARKDIDLKRRSTFNEKDEAEVEKSMKEVWVRFCEVLDSMAELREKQLLLSQIGSPSDEDLEELENCRHLYDSCKYQLVSMLEPVPENGKVAPPKDVSERLLEFLPVLCHEGDQREASTELLEALLQKIDAPFDTVISSSNLLVDQCPDGNVAFLSALLDYPGSANEYDPAELLAAACFSQVARIPLVTVVLEKIDVEPIAEEVSEVLQEFFCDVASAKKAIPKEDRSGRHPLLRTLLTNKHISLDLNATDGAGHTVFARCCADGDLLLLDMLRMYAKETLQPTMELEDGTTPLIQAVIRDQTAMVKELVAMENCEVDKESKIGTALGVAKALKRFDVTQILEAAGARKAVFNDPT